MAENDAAAAATAASEASAEKAVTAKPSSVLEGSKAAEKPKKESENGLPESNNEREIRKQVEFYFSDSNLAQDEFLRKHTGGPENKWVDLKLIHSFKRMRHFQPFTAVIAALKKSLILEVNDKDQVRRRIPLDKKYGKNAAEGMQYIGEESFPRSIYVKGFLGDAEKGDYSVKVQKEIEEFFEPYGPLRSVRLRREKDDKNTWKGSVFVEFDTKTQQEEFLAMEARLKFNGHDLLAMGKKEYCDMKMQDIKDGKVKANDKIRPDRFGQWRNNRNGRGNHRGGRRDDRNGRDHHRRDRDRPYKDRDGKLRDENWKEKRSKEQDESGRKKRRYSDDEEPKQERDERTSTPPPAAEKAVEEKAKAEGEEERADGVRSEEKKEVAEEKGEQKTEIAEANGESKKRSREEDHGEEDASEAKKVKA